jgi:hypothetical protein
MHNAFVLDLEEATEGLLNQLLVKVMFEIGT